LCPSAGSGDRRLPGQWPSADIVTSLPDDLQSAPGQFKLTIGVKKSTDLDNFFPFPMTVPDDAAIFRLEAE